MGAHELWFREAITYVQMIVKVVNCIFIIVLDWFHCGSKSNYYNYPFTGTWHFDAKYWLKCICKHFASNDTSNFTIILQDFELRGAWCGLVKNGRRIKLLANKPFATLIEDMNESDYICTSEGQSYDYILWVKLKLVYVMK